jgi:hypothetical protein
MRQVGSVSFSLSITHLSLQFIRLPTPLDPASFPFLRHLSCAGLSDSATQSLLPLIPQITSLHFLGFLFTHDVDLTLSASASLASLSIFDDNLYHLNDLSCTIIKDRVEVLRVRLNVYGSDYGKIVQCIAGSKVLKKVIFDRSASILTIETLGGTIARLKEMVEACKKKETIELWKENYTVDGKVDLNADVVSFLPITIELSIQPDVFICYRRLLHSIWHELTCVQFRFSCFVVVICFKLSFI